jgi:hypothetical protein
MTSSGTGEAIAQMHDINVGRVVLGGAVAAVIIAIVAGFVGHPLLHR